MVPAAPAADPRLDALRACGAALRRESHVLRERPELTWQQLCNRLQWEENPLRGRLESERRRRSAPGAAPWLRSRTRLRESDALRWTIAGHQLLSHACAISPDSTYFVTTSSDDTSKIWDAVTGIERAALIGDALWVNAYAISPDSGFIVTASHDKTCRIWDAVTGVERATLTGRTNWVNACAISLDSSFVLTASEDKTCKIWDAVTGRARATLTGHTDLVKACAISPDSTYIVTASSDRTSKIWDATTGGERATLVGHALQVTACAISPDSSYIVTSSGDGTLRIWDAATGTELTSFLLLGQGTCVAMHAWQPLAVCGDGGGGVYLIDLVGIEYGPIVVTAVDSGKGTGPAIRCPKCLRLHPINDAWLGRVIDCPTPSCGLSLRVNPFVTRMAKQGRGHWWSRK